MFAASQRWESSWLSVTAAGAADLNRGSSPTDLDDGCGGDAERRAAPLDATVGVGLGDLVDGFIEVVPDVRL
jgi:hypothetical protein